MGDRGCPDGMVMDGKSACDGSDGSEHFPLPCMENTQDGSWQVQDHKMGASPPSSMAERHGSPPLASMTFLKVSGLSSLSEPGPKSPPGKEEYSSRCANDVSKSNSKFNAASTENCRKEYVAGGVDVEMLAGTIIDPKEMTNQEAHNFINEETSQEEETKPDGMWSRLLGRRMSRFCKWSDKVVGNNDPMGGVLTWVAAILFLWYAITVITMEDNQAPSREADLLWTSMGEPLFPINIRCAASEGCVFRNHYSGDSPRSVKCRDAVIAAEKLGKHHVASKGEFSAAVMCYSDMPGDGMWVAFNGSSPQTTADPFGVEVYVVSEGPVMPMWLKLYSGRNTLQLIQTTNETYSSGDLGHKREEWFPSWQPPMSGQTLNPDTTTGSKYYMQLTMQAQWVVVKVHPSKNWLALTGDLGGFWTGTLELCTYLSEVILILKWVFQSC